VNARPSLPAGCEELAGVIAPNTDIAKPPAGCDASGFAFVPIRAALG
jgi:hypothetical protein